ncbi:hypothetical protein [Hydrocoleum sp. CS-953]
MGDLCYRFQIQTGDEIEKLAQEFNQMGVKLAESYLQFIGTEVTSC